MKARAKRIDNGEYVEGYLWLHTHRGVGSIMIGSGTRASSIDGFEVDFTTLEHKVGDEWLTEEEIVERCTIKQSNKPDEGVNDQ